MTTTPTKPTAAELAVLLKAIGDAGPDACHTLVGRLAGWMATAAVDGMDTNTERAIVKCGADLTKK